MEAIILQDWTTVSGTGPTPFIQDAADWIEGTQFSDWTFWLDCNFVTPASSVVLTYETAPSADDAQFQPAASISPVVASPTPTVARALLSRTRLAPIARFLRWKLEGPAAGTWSMTFRILGARGRAGGRAFEPPQLSGCAVWLRSDIGITLASNTNVTRWADQSGNGNDATQGTVVRQPGYNALQINGRPTVFFDASSAGTEKWMQLTNSLAGLTASHVFLVHKLVNALPVNGIHSGLWNLGTSGQSTHMPFVDNVIYDDGGSTTRYACGNPVVSLANAVVYEVQNGTSWKNLINGQTQFANAANTPALQAAPELGANQTIGVYYEGHWAELIIYGRILSADERLTVVGYLNALYDLGSQ